MSGGKKDMKVVILEPLAVEKDRLMEIAQEILGDSVEITLYDNRTTDPQELIERGKDADIVIEANQPLSAEVIKGFKNCKLLNVGFTGLDHVALDACREMGMMVCNCAGYSTACVADLVFGSLISFYRNIAACDTATRNSGTMAGLVGYELEGKKFGVVGTGAIGLRVARIAAAFGCEVYAYSRTVKDVPGVTYVSLDELMSSCDIISLHMPSNASTKGMISAEKIALMKKNAVLINMARGPVIDSQALADALNNDRILGACIDVFEMEPPIPQDHPLITAKHTVVTPHVAFATKEAFVKRAYILFENIKAYMNGTPQNVKVEA